MKTKLLGLKSVTVNNMTTKYLLQYSIGQYSDHRSEIIGLFNSKEKAEKALDIFEKIKDRLEKNYSIIYENQLDNHLYSLNEDNRYIDAAHSTRNIGYLISICEDFFDGTNVNFFINFPDFKWDIVNDFSILELSSIDKIYE